MRRRSGDKKAADRAAPSGRCGGEPAARDRYDARETANRETRPEFLFRGNRSGQRHSSTRAPAAMAKFQVKISGGSGKKKAGQGGMRAFPVGTPAVGKMRAFGKSSGNGGKASVLSRITGGGVGKVKAGSAGQWKHDKFPGAKTNDLRARINGGPTVTRHGGGRVVRVVRGAASGGDLRNSLGGVDARASTPDPTAPSPELRAPRRWAIFSAVLVWENTSASSPGRRSTPSLSDPSRTKISRSSASAGTEKKILAARRG